MFRRIVHRGNHVYQTQGDPYGYLWNVWDVVAVNPVCELALKGLESKLTVDSYLLEFACPCCPGRIRAFHTNLHDSCKLTAPSAPNIRGF